MNLPDAQVAAQLRMPYFPAGFMEGTCLACQRAHELNGAPICGDCLASVRAIIDPPRRQQREVLERIASQTSVELLRIARANARGDWRSAALLRRLNALGVDFTTEY